MRTSFPPRNNEASQGISKWTCRDDLYRDKFEAHLTNFANKTMMRLRAKSASFHQKHYIPAIMLTMLTWGLRSMMLFIMIAAAAIRITFVRTENNMSIQFSQDWSRMIITAKYVLTAVST